MLGDPDRLRPSAAGGPQGKLIGGARALYREKPQPGELEQSGLAPEDFASPEEQRGGIYYDLEQQGWYFDLWAENWPAIDLFLKVQTQWRVGMNGPYGLDYNVVLHELDRRALDADTYDELMDSIRVIEETALKALQPKQ